MLIAAKTIPSKKNYEQIKRKVEQDTKETV